MPRVLIKESNYEQLKVTQIYTLIIRKHGLIFKQVTDDSTFKSNFIVKLQPEEIKKLQLQEENKEYVLNLEFFLIEEKTFNFKFISLELPISILFDKLMKIIDPTYEERSLLSDGSNPEITNDDIQTRNNFIVLLNEFVGKAQLLITKPVNKSLEIFRTGIQGLEKTLKSGIKSLTSPFIKKELYNDTTTVLEKDFSPVEFLIQINKIYLNHIDSALLVKKDHIKDSQTELLVVENGEEDISSLERPAIIFVHPFGLDLSFWTPYMNMFYNKDYRVIAFDMRGWGGSEQSKNDNYKFSDYYDDFIAFLQDKKLLDYDKELIIVVGSLTGLMLLNQIDQKLKKRKGIKLILLSSSDCLETSLQNMIKKIPPPRTWGPLKKVGKNKLKEIILTKGIDPEIQEKIVSSLLSTDNKVLFETLKNLRQNFEGLKEKDLIELPFEKILIVSGDRDIFIPLKNLKKFEESKIATIKIIEGGNHFIAFENPSIVLKEIDEWLYT